ncbi:Profilin-2 [Golovinomyces cichoracearum]|uniref:Profilin n=1 Tax=Golovinomyces cichoracearum TaxID=62708 RepID=A0A420J4T3_9PEZI|nr:Profilin-2 [Golovinomyces cichoracearum]
MSWQEYVDTSLLGSGHVDKCAIYGLKDGGKWAASAGFEVGSTFYEVVKVSPEELKTITNALESNNYNKMYEDGFLVAGTRYVLIRGGDGSIIARQGRDGLVIAKTLQAILIAHHNSEMIAGNCSTTVQGLADYLTSNNC